MMKWLYAPLSLPVFLVVGWGWLGLAPSAMAIGQFKDEFEGLYVKQGSIEAKDVAFAAAVRQARCNICHAGSSKKDHNGYGQALAVLLDRREDRDNKEKIREVLGQVFRMKSNPDDDKSPTYGELIEQGKLPGGNPE